MTWRSDRDSVDRRDAPALSSAGLQGGDLDRIAKRLSPEDWLVLSLIPINSEPAFEYRRRENE